MTPEYLSKSTRQTRSVLLVIASASLVMACFGGSFKDGNLLTTPVLNVEFAHSYVLNLVLLVLCLYFGVSFLLAALSDRKNIGATPRELALYEKEKNAKDTYDRRQRGYEARTNRLLSNTNLIPEEDVLSLRNVFGENVISDSNLQRLLRFKKNIPDEEEGRILHFNEWRGPLSQISLSDTIKEYIERRRKDREDHWEHKRNSYENASQLKEGERLFKKDTEAPIELLISKTQEADKKLEKVCSALDQECINREDEADELRSIRDELKEAQEAATFKWWPKKKSVTFWHETFLKIEAPLGLGLAGFVASAFMLYGVLEDQNTCEDVYECWLFDDILSE